MAEAKNAAWAAHDAKVRPYHRAHRLVTWLERALLLGGVTAVFATPLGSVVEGWAIAALGDSVPAVLFYFAALGGLWQIVTLPLAVASQQIERQYGLSKQPWKAWWLDVLKGWGVGAVLGGAYLAAVAAIARVGGDLWWIGVASLTAVFTVLLAQLAPIVLLPLFVPMEKLPDGPVRQRLLALCARFGVSVRDVFLLKLGVKTEKANAAFMGLGPTKRIAIGDTLCREASEDEIEAVFAHELGHQVHRDVAWGIVVGLAVVTLTFGLAAWGLRRLGLSDPGQPSTLFVFFALSSALQIAFQPLLNAWSRRRERAADEFALRAGLGEPLRSALHRLVVQNWGLFYPGRIRELGMSHPAPWRRLTRLDGAR
jgi:STE24 endopeptidase